jgi:hypothetical protein
VGGKKDNYFPPDRYLSVNIPRRPTALVMSSLGQNRSSPGNNSLPADIGKMGKDFLFYANWCNFTGFLPSTRVHCKYMKTGLRRLENRIAQQKPVTLAQAVLFSGVTGICG